MKTVSKWLCRISSGWVALAGLIIFLAFTALVLPGQAEQAESYSAEIGSPDSSFFYGADQLYQFAENYGSQGRQDYIRARWTFDVVWPLVYTLFLTTAISLLIKKAEVVDGFLKYLNLIPILGMTLDFMENAAASVVMARYPLNTPILPYLAGVFTALKWLSIGGSFLALLIVLLLVIWKWIKKDGQSEK